MSRCTSRRPASMRRRRSHSSKAWRIGLMRAKEVRVLIPISPIANDTSTNTLPENRSNHGWYAQFHIVGVTERIRLHEVTNRLISIHRRS